MRASCCTMNILKSTAEKVHDVLTCPLCGVFCEPHHLLTECPCLEKDRGTLANELNLSSVKDARTLCDPWQWNKEQNVLINRFCDLTEHRAAQARVVSCQPELSELVDLSHPYPLHENILGEVFDWKTAGETWRVRAVDYNPFTNRFQLDTEALDVDPENGRPKQFNDIHLNDELESCKLSHIPHSKVTGIPVDNIDTPLGRNVEGLPVRFRREGATRFRNGTVLNFCDFTNLHKVSLSNGKTVGVDLNKLNISNNVRIPHLENVLMHIRMSPKAPAAPAAARPMPLRVG